MLHLLGFWVFISAATVSVANDANTVRFVSVGKSLQFSFNSKLTWKNLGLVARWPLLAFFCANVLCFVFLLGYRCALV